MVRSQLAIGVSIVILGTIGLVGEKLMHRHRAEPMAASSEARVEETPPVSTESRSVTEVRSAPTEAVPSPRNPESSSKSSTSRPAGKSLAAIFREMKATDAARELEAYFLDTQRAQTPEDLVARSNEIRVRRKRVVENADEASQAATEFLSKSRGEPGLTTERTLAMSTLSDLPQADRPEVRAEVGADLVPMLDAGGSNPAYYENAALALLKNSGTDPAVVRSEIQAKIAGTSNPEAARSFMKLFDEISQQMSPHQSGPSGH